MSQHQRPTPTWRIPAGILIMLSIIALWAVILVSWSESIGQFPVLIQAIIYLLAGILWIFPMRPLIIWMETGRFRT